MDYSPHSLQPAGLLCPWDFPGRNIGVVCQRIFLTQESNLGLLHCKQILYRLSYDRFKCYSIGTPLLCQCLRLCTPTAGPWIQSLVRELRSRMLRGSAPTKKTPVKKNSYNI